MCICIYVLTCSALLNCVRVCILKGEKEEEESVEEVEEVREVEVKEREEREEIRPKHNNSRKKE